MATLEKIRNRAGLLVGVVGVALFAFIIGDGLRSGHTFFQQSKETVLDVDGNTVKIRDFDASVEELKAIYASQGNANLTEEQQAQVRNEVFENTVRSILINEEADKLGFTVTSDELFDMVQGENIHPMVQQLPMFRNEAGQFDRNALLRFLQTIEMKDLSKVSPEDRAQIENGKLFWFYFEKVMRLRKMEEKFGTLVSKGVVTNSIDAKAEFEDNKVSADFDYVVQNYTTLPDSLFPVTPAEIKDLYNKRKELYKQEDAAEVKYIALEISPSEEDFAEVEKTLQGVKEEFTTSDDVLDVVNENSDVPFYNAYFSAAALSADAKKFVDESQVGDVRGPVLIGNTYHMYRYLGKTLAPDSVQVSELTLPMMPEADLKHYSDSLLNVLKAGQPFSELAENLTSKQFNGDLGWLTEEAAARRVDESYRNAIFNAAINGPFLLKTTRGTHLIQVTAKTSPVEKYKVADISVDVEPSTRTTNMAQTKLSQYILKNNTLASFESEAAGSGYTCQTAVLDKNDQSLAGMSSTRPAVRWAFESKKGDMSKIFEDNNRFLVVMAGNHLSKGYRPVEAVSDILKRELVNDKKAEKMMADLKAKNCTSLEQCGGEIQSVKFVSFATRMITGIGIEPALNVVVPTAEVGKVAGPVKGKNGVYMLKVTEKHTNPGEFNLVEQRQSMDAQNGYRFMFQAVQSLRDKAEVEDNRVRFY